MFCWEVATETGGGDLKFSSSVAVSEETEGLRGKKEISQTSEEGPKTGQL